MDSPAGVERKRDASALTRYVSAEEAFELLQQKFFERFSSVREAFIRLDSHQRKGYVEPADLRKQLESMGIHMTTHEFKKLWRMYDTLNDGKLTYGEINQNIGNLIKPVSIGLQGTMRRPETPIMSDALKTATAARLRRTVPSVDAVWKELDKYETGQITHATFISGLRLLGVKHLSDQQTFQLMQKHRNPDNFSGLMTRKEFESCINELMNVTANEPKEDKEVVQRTLKKIETKLVRVLPRHDRDEVIRVLKPFDVDKINSLNYDQFRKALASLGVNFSNYNKEIWEAFIAKYDPLKEGTLDINDFASKWVGDHRISMASPHGSTLQAYLFSDPEKRVSTFAHANFGPWANLGLRPISDTLSGRPLDLKRMARMAASTVGMTENETTIILQIVGRGAQLRSILEDMDSHKTGEVTKGQLKRALEMMDVEASDDVVASIAYRYDKNKNGMFFFSRFLSVLSKFLSSNLSPSTLASVGLERIPTDPDVLAQEERNLSARHWVTVNAASYTAGRQPRSVYDPLLSNPRTLTLGSTQITTTRTPKKAGAGLTSTLRRRGLGAGIEDGSDSYDDTEFEREIEAELNGHYPPNRNTYRDTESNYGGTAYDAASRGISTPQSRDHAASRTFSTSACDAYLDSPQRSVPGTPRSARMTPTSLRSQRGDNAGFAPATPNPEDKKEAERVVRRLKSVLGRSWTSVAAETTRKADTLRSAQIQQEVNALSATGTPGRPQASPAAKAPQTPHTPRSLTGSEHSNSFLNAATVQNQNQEFGSTSKYPPLRSTKMHSNRSKGLYPTGSEQGNVSAHLLSDTLQSKGVDLSSKELNTLAKVFGDGKSIDVDKLGAELTAMRL